MLVSMLTLEHSWVRDGNYRVGGYWEGWPGEGVITQIYGQRSVTGSVHTGTDIAAKYRSNCVAPIGGYARMYNYGTFGKHVIIELAKDDEYGQLYCIMAHMDGFLLNMDRRVDAGEPLGLVGYSGLVYPADINGTHIHFGFGLDPLISGNYQRCIDPYIFIQRAEEEYQMSEARLGLQFIAGGDWSKVSPIYEKLRAAGIIDKLFKEPALSLDLSKPYVEILNTAQMMRFNILAVAASDLADEAYQLVK